MNELKGKERKGRGGFVYTNPVCGVGGVFDSLFTLLYLLYFT